MTEWVVVLNTGGASGPHVYGPTEDEETARDFAAFLTATVDPATAHPLHSPTKELLANWQRFEEDS